MPAPQETCEDTPSRRGVLLTPFILQCSMGDPCERCIAAATSNHASRCLGWMHCIRPSLERLNIFTRGRIARGWFPDGEADVTFPDPPISHGRPIIPSSDASTCIPVPFDWDIESMWAYIAHWFITEREPPGTRIVGIMTTMKFTSVLSQYVGSFLGSAFRRLITATALLKLESFPFESQVMTEDFAKMVTRAGNQVLRALEAQLEPRALSRADQRKLGTIFIILVGTTIAIGYTSSRMLYPPVSKRTKCGSSLF
jgi:hypothetical protein